MEQPTCGCGLPQPGYLTIGPSILGYHNNMNWPCIDVNFVLIYKLCILYCSLGFFPLWSTVVQQCGIGGTIQILAVFVIVVLICWILNYRVRLKK